MKLFLDTANLDELREAAGWGIVDGVTTNPSIIAREGVAVEQQIPRICEIIDGDVSVEVVSSDWRDMVRDGKALSRLHPNVVVKCPVTKDGIRATRALSGEGIRVNVTLCFSAAQALLAAKAGAFYVSPFVGRVDDSGGDGLGLIRDIAGMFGAQGFQTQILAASVRNTQVVVEVAKAGAHAVTLPLKSLEQLFLHPLTDQGLEQFLRDHAKVFQSDPALSRA